MDLEKKLEEFYRDVDGTIFTAGAWHNLLG